MAEQGDYTVRRAAEDWLAAGLSGRSVKTVEKNRYCLEPVLAVIGARPLGDLEADEVHAALKTMETRYGSAAIRVAHSALIRAIRHAVAGGLAGGNVAERVDTPSGLAGRRPRAFSAEQVARLLAVSEHSRMHAYIALLAVGIKAEEARGLRWDDVTLEADAPHVHVWRSLPARGRAATRKSPRRLSLPPAAVSALRRHRGLPEGRHELVFASRDGRELDPANVRREFRAVVRAAGIPGHWTPSDLRCRAALRLFLSPGPRRPIAAMTHGR